MKNAASDENGLNSRLATLLSECAAQHEPALAELYKQVSTQLFGVVLRILRIESVAEDALQETFVKIWNNSGTYSAQVGTPMAWMVTIARHQALDMLRKRRSREDREYLADSDYIESAPDHRKPMHLMQSDSTSLLHCLELLDPKTRDCIVKAYCEGYSQEELSTAHKAPLGTVKSWIRRGLVSLRSCLDEQA